VIICKHNGKVLVLFCLAFFRAFTSIGCYIV